MTHTSALPPRDMDHLNDRNSDLVRWGIKWQGPKEPIAVQMDDGLWTPWHVAADEIQKLRELILHSWVHNGYPNCGYNQMDSEEKEKFDEIISDERHLL